MELSKDLQSYEDLGVVFTESAGDERIAQCPFCGKQKHFYVNNKTAAFDCKRCGISGGKSKFMELIYSDHLTATNDGHLIIYAAEKQIPLTALKAWGIAYDKNRGRFLFPYWDHTGKFCDIRYAKFGEKPKSTRGSEVGLFGIRNLLNESVSNVIPTVCICGGESDCISLANLHTTTGYSAHCVGLPGETTFKKNWINFFRDKEVYLFLDNDETGDKGHKKVGELLEGVAKSIQYINWPTVLPQGYDLRDYILSGGIKPETWENLKKLCKPYRRTDSPETQQTKTTQQKTTQSLDKPPPYVNIDDIIKGFSEYMSLTPNLETAIKLTMATVLSTIIPGPDPAWLFITGPPGSGKTTILSALKDVSKCYFQSTLRARSLISGYTNNNGFDPSILARIGNKCLVLKDFTEILGKPHVEREEIFSILRGAYDGEAELDFGNGQFRKYKCNFACVAGVTDTIYSHSTAALGERFIKFRLQPSHESVLDQQRSAMLHALNGQKSRESLRTTLSNFFRRDRTAELTRNIEGVPLWFRERTTAITRLTALLRSTVERFNYGIQRDNPIYRPQFETGSRLAVQMQRLGIALALVLEKEIDEEIFEIVKQVCRDTVYGFVFDIVATLNSEGDLSSKQLSEIIGIRQDSVDKYMDDLCMLTLTDKYMPKTLGKIPQPIYSCSQKVKELWKTSKM